MQTVNIPKELSGKKIDRAILTLFPNLTSSALYKALRKKDIKVNGIRVKEDYIVKNGDEVQVYITDSIINGEHSENTIRSIEQDIVFEDNNILIINKPQGVSIEGEEETRETSLIESVQQYLDTKYEKGTVNATLCHRLDRNTGGLVILALNNISLAVILNLIKEKQITKLYRCIVYGRMPSTAETLTAYLEKNSEKSKVFISDTQERGFLTINTAYRVLEYNKLSNLSLLEIDLLTGRTHQIRAHLAFIGRPIIGDGKYGTNVINRPFKVKYQQLWASKLIFNFEDAGHLNYLRDRVFKVDPVFEIKV